MIDRLCRSEAELQEFAAKLAAVLQTPQTVSLLGDVGAGKTTFVKGIAKGLGITETVQSPTFTISRQYDTTSGTRLFHYDFYRLTDPGIMGDELAETMNDATTIVVIEWATIVENLLSNDSLIISFSSPSENERLLRFKGPAKLLKKVEKLT